MNKGLFLLGAVAALGLGCQGRLDRVETESAPETASPRRGGTFRLPPAELIREAQARRAKEPLAAGGPHILYVNFTGDTLRGGAGCSSATANCSFIVECSGTVAYPAYRGSATQKQQTLTQLQEYLQDFNVQIVTTRPAAGPYMMAMVGGTSNTVCSSSQGALGVAPLDCGNQLGDNDIVFAFSDGLRNDPVGVAATIAQEAAHGWGLEHTTDQTDVMYPFSNNNTVGFINRAMNVADTNGGNGRSTCTGSTTQNSYQMMLDMLGSSAPDTMAPTVRFTEPTNGAMVPPTFTIRVDAQDNVGIASVDLVLDPGTPGQMMASASAPPFQWGVTNIAAGPHTMKVTARDSTGMTAMEMITVTVVPGAGGAGGAGMGGSGMAGAGGGMAGAGGGTAGTGGGMAGAGGGAAGAGGSAGGSAGGAAGGSAGGGGVSAGDSHDLGYECRNNSECDTGLCVKVAGIATGVCGATCQRDEDCGSDPTIVCADISNRSLCVPNDFGGGPQSKTVPGTCQASPGQAGTVGLLLPLVALGLVRRRRQVR